MVYDSSSRRLVEGNLLENRSFSSDTNRYKFTNKERDNESTYDYFGARYYDSRIGRWGGVDTLFMKHYDFSPYNYVLNNPLRFVDPDGKGPWYKVFEFIAKQASKWGFKRITREELGKPISETPEDIDMDGIPDNHDDFDNRTEEQKEKTKKDFEKVKDKIEKTSKQLEEENKRVYDYEKKLKEEKVKKIESNKYIENSPES